MDTSCRLEFERLPEGAGDRQKGALEYYLGYVAAARLAKETDGGARERVANEAGDLFDTAASRFATGSPEYGAAQYHLGLVSLAYGSDEFGADPKALNVAVNAFIAALSVFDRKSDERRWAEIKISLGDAMRLFGESENDPDHLAHSTEDYRDALGVITNDDVDGMKWGRTQLHLGQSLDGLGKATAKPELFIQAIAAYKMALQARGLSDHRDVLALIYYSLGQAYADYGLRHKDDVSSYEEAIRSYEIASKDVTFESNRDLWFNIFNRWGSALLRLGKRQKSDVPFIQAESKYDLMLSKVSHFKDRKPWAIAKNGLALAKYEPGKLAGDKSKVLEAIDIYKSIQKEISYDSAPRDWLNVQIGLGIALLEYANMSRDMTYFDAASQAFQEIIKKNDKSRNGAITFHARHEGLMTAFYRAVASGDYLRAKSALDDVRVFNKQFKNSPLPGIATEYADRLKDAESALSKVPR